MTAWKNMTADNRKDDSGVTGVRKGNLCHRGEQSQFGVSNFINNPIVSTGRWEGRSSNLKKQSQQATLGKTRCLWYQAGQTSTTK